MVRLVIILLILASVACSLSTSKAADAPTRTPYVITGSTPAVITPTKAAVATPTPTPRPTTQNTNNNTGNVPPACTPRYDWPLYTVVAGDTLGTLAQRTGATVAQLVTANCLSNANLISVGQQLRVPRQPDPVIPPTSAAPGPVIVSPALNFDGLTYFVAPFSPVYIDWPDAARYGAREVEFLYRPDGSPNAISLGIDYDLSYDAAITWSVPGNTRGQLYAVTGGSYVVESARVRIEAVQAVPGRDINAVSLSAYTEFDGSTYRVTGDTDVLITWDDQFARTASNVEFIYYSAGYPGGLSLGLDPTMMDGASVQWHIPPGANGQLTARVRMPDGMYFETPSIGVIAG